MAFNFKSIFNLTRHVNWHIIQNERKKKKETYWKVDLKLISFFWIHVWKYYNQEIIEALHASVEILNIFLKLSNRWFKKLSAYLIKILVRYVTNKRPWEIDRFWANYSHVFTVRVGDDTWYDKTGEQKKKKRKQITKCSRDFHKKMASIHIHSLIKFQRHRSSVCTVSSGKMRFLSFIEYKKKKVEGREKKYTYLWIYKCTQVKDEPYTLVTHTYVHIYDTKCVACSPTQVVSRYLWILVASWYSERDVKCAYI